jgi:putative ATPase
MPDLFDDEPAIPPPAAKRPAATSASAPLAERLRPHTLDEVVGQSHLLGPGKPLRVAFESGTPHSMILWGPPGVGKTTLARLMANAFGLDFIAISAVLGGVKDIREAVERATATRRATDRATLVFVDEVHRFNKAQQDAFLPHVESGLFVFVGATTENPSFEVVGALLSRAAVYVLQPLSAEELELLIERAASGPLGGLQIEPGARQMLIDLADGDARRLLNALEVAAQAFATERARKKGKARDAIDVEFLRATLPATLRRFDKGGDNFYDQISALHKSVRGSDPDAALYWLVRMIDGGTDPLYLARRIVRMAVEDVGLADPRALRLALDCAEVYERLGSPEGELALAEATVYLAVTQKSNAVYVAYNRVRAAVAQGGTAPVPMHLRNAPTRLMKNLGYGTGYRYAHDEEGGFAPGERYLPDEVEPGPWYEPTERGLEARIRERLDKLRQLNRVAREGEGGGEAGAGGEADAGERSHMVREPDAGDRSHSVREDHAAGPSHPAREDHATPPDPQPGDDSSSLNAQPE